MININFDNQNFDNMPVNVRSPILVNHDFIHANSVNVPNSLHNPTKGHIGYGHQSDINFISPKHKIGNDMVKNKSNNIAHHPLSAIGLIH